jgi:hypothetical protein
MGSGFKASSERLSKSVNVIANATGIDLSKMSTSKLENVVLGIGAGGRRGFSDATDLKDAHAEQSYEMRANGLRPPSYGKWLSDIVATRVFTERLDDTRKAFQATKEGNDAKRALDEVRAARDSSFKLENDTRSQYWDKFKADYGKVYYNGTDKEHADFQRDNAKMHDLLVRSAGMTKQYNADADKSDKEYRSKENAFGRTYKWPGINIQGVGTFK